VPALCVLAFDLREEQLVPVVGAGNVAGAKFRGQAVTVIVEEKQRMEADGLEMSVVGAAFLLPMHRALTGIHVEDHGIGWVQRLDLADHIAVDSHQPDQIRLSGQQLRLEPVQRRGQRATAIPDLW
jgi:hypothetical protein